MFAHGAVRIGITANCWLNDDMPALGAGTPYQQVLDEIALAGYEGCSLGSGFPRDPAVLRKALDLRGLRISEPWVSTYFTCGGMRERTIRDFSREAGFLAAVGGTVVVVCELGHAVHQQPVALAANKPQFTDVEWDALNSGLNKLGGLAAEAGLRLVYHHHMGTGVQTRAEVDRLLAGTDPDLVGLVLDTGHLTWAGDDPLALATDHSDRIRHVHLKDLRTDVLRSWASADDSFVDAVRAGAFTVPGDGSIDFAPIVKTLATAGYRGWLMVEAEQDPTVVDPFEYAIKGRTYLREAIGI